MNDQTRNLIAIFLFIIITTGGLVYWSFSIEKNSYVISTIDEVNIIDMEKSGDRLNTSIIFTVILFNRGKLEKISFGCSQPESFLQLKNSTASLTYSNGSLENNTSYYFSDTAFDSSCDGISTELWISEGQISELNVLVPFSFVSGSYSLFWYYSIAKEFNVVSLIVDIDNSNIEVVFDY